MIRLDIPGYSPFCHVTTIMEVISHHIDRFCLHSKTDLKRIPSCSAERSSRMIPVPSGVATEVGKEATGPEVPIQTEMRILCCVDK